MPYVSPNGWRYADEREELDFLDALTSVSGIATLEALEAELAAAFDVPTVQAADTLAKLRTIVIRQTRIMRAILLRRFSKEEPPRQP